MIKRRLNLSKLLQNGTAATLPLSGTRHLWLPEQHAFSFLLLLSTAYTKF